MRECPFCQKEIKDTDIECAYCGTVLWLDEQKPALNKVVYLDHISPSLKQFEPFNERVADKKDAKIKKMRVIATVVLAVLYVVLFIYNYINGSFTGRGDSTSLALMIGAFLVPSITYIFYMIYPKHNGAKYGYHLSAILIFMLIFISSFSNVSGITPKSEKQPTRNTKNPYDQTRSMNDEQFLKFIEFNKNMKNPLPGLGSIEDKKSGIAPKSEGQVTRDTRNLYDQIRSMSDDQFLKFIEFNKNLKNPLPGLGYLKDKKSGQLIRIIQEQYKVKK